MSALRLDTTRCPLPAPTATAKPLPILLGARHDLTVTSTAQINRLRALLRDSNDTDHHLARAALPDTTLTALARRRLSRDASREQAIHHAEIRRLALAIHDARQALKDNQTQLQSIVDDFAPGLTQRPGIGPVAAAQAIVSFSHPGRCRNDAAFASLAGTCPIPASSANRPQPPQPRRRPLPQPRHPHHRHRQNARLPHAMGCRPSGLHTIHKSEASTSTRRQPETTDQRPWASSGTRQGAVGRTERRHTAGPLRPVHLVTTSFRPDDEQPGRLLARMQLVDVDLIARPTT